MAWNSTSVVESFWREPADSKLNRCEQMRSVDDAREHDRAHAIDMGSHLGERLESGLARHGQIEQQQIRFDGVDDRDRLFAAAGLANDLKPEADIHAVHVLDHRRRRCKQVAQAHAEHALVVGEDDRHGNTIASGRSKLN